MIFIILTFLNLTDEKNRKDPPDALLKAVVFFALYLYAVTEILSLFRACTRTSILIVWLAADICLILRLIAGRQGGNIIQIIKGSFRSFFCGKYAPVRTGFLAFFFVMFIMAYLTVPYNWDSMTYHLTRMAIWVQNATVAHYPAVDSRELSTPPLTEFVMMHLYLLCGKKDVLLNMIQFLSFVFNTYMIYRICFLFLPYAVRASHLSRNRERPVPDGISDPLPCSCALWNCFRCSITTERSSWIR